MKHAIVFVVLMVMSYFTFSILWAFIGDEGYIATLREPGQLAGWALLYWWMPGMFYLGDRGLLS